MRECCGTLRPERMKRCRSVKNRARSVLGVWMTRRAKRVISVCPRCGVDFEHKASQRRTYCSRSCNRESVARMSIAGSNGPLRPDRRVRQKPRRRMIKKLDRGKVCFWCSVVGACGCVLSLGLEVGGGH